MFILRPKGFSLDIRKIVYMVLFLKNYLIAHSIQYSLQVIFLFLIQNRMTVNTSKKQDTLQSSFLYADKRSVEAKN